MLEYEVSSDDGRVSPDLFEEEEFSTPLSCAEDDSNQEWAAMVGYCTSSAPHTAHHAAGQGKEGDDHTRTDPCVPPESSPSAPTSRIGLNDNKAGMEGLDKTKINQIILEASKGSKFYENELRKEKQMSRRVGSMLEELRRITPAQRVAALRAADKELEVLEAERDLTRIIVHIDMDAFYASVEIRDNPHLKDVPMAVGSKSMLSTSNYLARRYGVRAAMPGFIAKKLCPDLVIVPLNFSKYREASKTVRDVLAHYDPNFHSVGLDESYLDLTEFVQKHTDQRQEKGESLTPHHWRCAEEVVEEMRRKIRERTALTASAGVAPNMMLAKVASDMNKPDGQYTVTASRDTVVEFVQKLPIRKISGIGKVTEHMLNALKVTTCGDLYQQRAVLRLLFSQTSSTHFLSVSIGLGSTHVHRGYDRKSMSTERTFAEISSVADLQKKCHELCSDLARDMQRDLIKGNTVTLKLKSVHFEVKSRAVTLPQPVSSADQLYSAASELLSAEIRACSPAPLRLRLMGVRISSLWKGEGGEGGRKQETLDVYVHPHSAHSSLTQSTVAQEPIKNLTRNTHLSQTDADDISPSTHSVKCPICGQALDGTQGDIVNTHIDECLNVTAISRITASPNTTTAHLATESPKKLQVSAATVSPHRTRGRGRRGRGGKKETVTGSRKRQLLKQNDKGEVDCDTRKRRKTLDQFWNN